MIHGIFLDAKPDAIGLEEVLAKVVETDTVSSFQPPVEVWIDPEGYCTVLVQDTTYPGSSEMFERERKGGGSRGEERTP